MREPRFLVGRIVSIILLLAPSVLAPAAAPQPVGQSGSWTIIFDDEFNGSSLDLSKWRPNWLGSSDTSITPPVQSAEVSCYDPAQVSEGNGELDLTAVARSCNGYSYASGMIQSNGKFNFTYGYMEARIWTPEGTGMWPAFWSDGHNWPQDGEIDVLEAYGTDALLYHYHYAGCGGDCAPGGSVDVPGATSGWHTYAADWEPGVITWYYDGQRVWQYTTSITSSPMYLIVNLGLNSSSSAVPATMRVDYVRVWQH
jgi:beta-glucanase (GH16 family)